MLVVSDKVVLIDPFYGTFHGQGNIRCTCSLLLRIKQEYKANKDDNRQFFTYPKQIQWSISKHAKIRLIQCCLSISKQTWLMISAFGVGGTREEYNFLEHCSFVRLSVLMIDMR